MHCFALAVTLMALGHGPRVISFVPSLTDIAVAIGGASQLVARTDYDRDPRLSRLPSVGGTTNPNLEVVEQLRPDVVITWDDSEAPGLAATLRQLRLRIVQVHTAGLHDLRADIRILGSLLGREHSADSLWQTIDGQLRDLETHRSARSRPGVFFVVWLRPLITAGSAALVDTLISIAGGRNVFHDMPQAWPTISSEALAARHVDIIVVPESRIHSRRDVLDNPVIAGVVSLMHPRVVTIEDDLVNRPGPRTGEAARALAAAIQQP